MTSEPLADEILDGNRRFAEQFTAADLPPAPARRVAVLVCMDARIDVLDALGLSVGDAHVVRNAGGVVTDDVIRSLALSQRRFGTREIVLVHHTNCGLEGLDEEEFKQELRAETGGEPAWSLGSFRDPYASVDESIRRLQSSPFLLHRDHIRGFVYDVRTGRLAGKG